MFLHPYVARGHCIIALDRQRLPLAELEQQRTGMVMLITFSSSDTLNNVFVALPTHNRQRYETLNSNAFKVRGLHDKSQHGGEL